jgi:hypothetical protein
MEDLDWGHFFLMWCTGFAGVFLWEKISESGRDFNFNDYKWLALLNTIVVFPIIVLFSL